MNRIGEWWRAREPRERAMLGLMLAAIAAFALWYGVCAPLRQARDAAVARHAQAAQALREIESALAQAAAIDARLPASPAGEAYASAIADAAGAAGLALGRQHADDDGALRVVVERAAPAALFAWLDALRGTHGIAPSTLRIDKRDGRLHAELRFDPPPS